MALGRNNQRSRWRNHIVIKRNQELECRVLSQAEGQEEGHSTPGIDLGRSIGSDPNLDEIGRNISQRHDYLKERGLDPESFSVMYHRGITYCVDNELLLYAGLDPEDLLSMPPEDVYARLRARTQEGIGEMEVSCRKDALSSPLPTLFLVPSIRTQEIFSGLCFLGGIPPSSQDTQLHLAFSGCSAVDYSRDALSSMMATRAPELEDDLH